MYSLSRIILLHCNSLKHGKELLVAHDVNRKSFHFNENLNDFTKPKSVVRDKVFLNSGQQEGVMYDKDKTDVSRYSEAFLKLSRLIRKSKRDISQVCAPIINKMYHISQVEGFVYGNSSNRSSDLNKFITTNDFKSFCRAVHNQLPQMKPGTLIALLRMEYFGVPVSSPLMRKVLTLILDNINFYNAFEKMYIFLTISRPYFKSSKECEDLKKVFEVYFESTFEEELSFCRISDAQLAGFLQNNTLSVKVKTLFARKIISDLFSKRLPIRYMTHYLEAIFVQPVPLFSHSEALEILNKSVAFLTTDLFHIFVTSYRRIVDKDDSLYNETFCNDFVTESIKNVRFTSRLFYIMHSLCLMGHLNDDLLKLISESALIIQFKKLEKALALNLASVFVQTCIHERDVITPGNWTVLKHELESCFTDTKEINDFILKWCEYLTFLECDVKDLLSSIFEELECDYRTVSGNHSEALLRLYQLARAYFSHSCTVPSDEVIRNLLENSAARNTSFPAGLTDVLGGEDYVLKNCTTSDNHFLHYVAVLGSDNKPINLSSFKQKATPEGPTEKHLYNIEDVERPSGSKLVIFQNFTGGAIKFRNSSLTPGMVRMHLKSLEPLNSHVILLPKKLQKLTQERRTEYLRTQLKEVIERHKAEK